MRQRGSGNLPATALMAMMMALVGSVDVGAHPNIVRALQSKLRRAQIPRPPMEQPKRRNLQQNNVDLCPSILDTVFTEDETSRTICQCQPTTTSEYLLECNYSQHCGTFCAEPGFETDQYHCFERKDRYIIQLTDDFYVNTLYEGCGTYVTEGTAVCLLEMRHLNGLISNRCLSIDGDPCQCSTASCGDFAFFCRPPQTATWEPFGLDECDENNSYGTIEPGTVQSLLSSVIFDTEECFVNPDLTTTTTTASSSSPTDPTEPFSTTPTEEQNTTTATTAANETTEAPTVSPTHVPTEASMTRNPTPFVDRVTMPLESFTMVFSLQPPNNKWHPNSMERGVKRVIMRFIMSQLNLFDLQLSCRWLGTPVLQNGIQTRNGDSGTSSQQEPQAQLECYGYIELNTQGLDHDIAEHMIQVETPTMLQDAVNLSTLLSEQLGESVVVLQVNVDIPLLSEMDDTMDGMDEPLAPTEPFDSGDDATTASTNSSVRETTFLARRLISFLLGLFWVAQLY